MGRRVLPWRPIALAALVFGQGCRSLGPHEDLGPQTHRDVLTREEIMASTAQQGDLLQAIRSLRPHFLALPRGVVARGSSSSAPIMVFVERTQQSGIESLRSIAASKVAEVRYLEPMASQIQFGVAAGGGALLVKLFRPDDPYDALDGSPTP